MSKQEYIENIIAALRAVDGVGNADIGPETQFSDIEAGGSKSVIDFQMNMRKLPENRSSTDKVRLP